MTSLPVFLPVPPFCFAVLVVSYPPSFQIKPPLASFYSMRLVRVNPELIGRTNQRSSHDRSFLPPRDRPIGQVTHPIPPLRSPFRRSDIRLHAARDDQLRLPRINDNPVHRSVSRFAKNLRLLETLTPITTPYQKGVILCI